MKKVRRTRIRWEWLRYMPKEFILFLAILHFPLSLLMGIFCYGLVETVGDWWYSLREIIHFESVQEYKDWKVLIPALRESYLKYKRVR